MAFPTIESITTSSTSSNSTSHSFDLPATINSGDLLLALIANNGGDENIAVSGWTQIGHQPYSGGIFAKVATGSEGSTETATTDTSEKIAAVVLRITGWSGTVSDIEADHEPGPGSSISMPTLTPSHGSDDYLWVVFRSGASSTVTTTVWPTNYTDNQTTVVSTGGGAASHAIADVATRELASSSDQPSGWTISQNYGTSNGAWIIAIRPDQGGGGSVANAYHYFQNVA